MFRCNIRGQQEALSVLDRAVSSGHIAHAYLFIGPEGVGKRTCAIEFAKALNCQEGSCSRGCQGGIPCGQCPTCRAIADGNFPDVSVVSPSGATIRIEQVREVRRSAGLKAHTSGWRVWVFEDSDKMTEEAANALLRTLEEPPPRSVMVLTTSNPFLVLPTIVSRCQVVRFGHVSLPEINAILTERFDLSDQDRELFASLSGGIPAKAIRLARGEERQARERALDLLRKIGTRDTLEILKISESLAEDRTSLVGYLEMWTSWYRDILILKETGDTGLLLNRDRQEEISGVACENSTDKLISAIQILQEALNALRQNANARLCMDSVLLRLDRLLGDPRRKEN
ncbi:MAG TPA: DNA polymerase III subunit delta' [Firmicutes bacterium]|nr:DNA polymerase III subunit delta' [Bacillota bacterium]